MRKGFKVKNIGIKGMNKRTNSGRINHSTEEWKAIVEGIRQRDSQRIKSKPVISDETRESYEAAILLNKQREAEEEAEKKEKRSKKFWPRRKKKTEDVDYSQIPATLLKTLNIEVK